MEPCFDETGLLAAVRSLGGQWRRRFADAGAESRATRARHMIGDRARRHSRDVIKHHAQASGVMEAPTRDGFDVPRDH
jgi:hypothetical protein